MKNLMLVVMLAVTLLAGCYPVSQAPAASTISGEPARVTLAMGYIPSVQFAPFYVAQAKGYFKDAGLDVNFRYGFESDLLKLVGTNELSFMIGSGEEVILGRSSARRSGCPAFSVRAMSDGRRWSRPADSIPPR